MILLKIKSKTNNTNEDYGWRQFGVNIKEIIVIEGDHLTMLDQQNCDSLAQIILQHCTQLFSN